MKTTLNLRTFAAVLITSFALGMFAPVAAHAASAPATATITATSLKAKSDTRITLSGTTKNTSKISFTIKSEDGSRTFFKSKKISVRNDKWNSKITKKLKDGTYQVSVYNANGKSDKRLIKGTLIVGKPAAILKVSPIALLGGGTAQPGQSIPVSYLQVTNVSSSTVMIKGFWLEQSGTAPDASVAGFSSVDGKGGSRAASDKALSKGKGYVPSAATLLPGERKLFTLKANVSSRYGAFAGQSLMLNVTGIDADATLNATFPIRGTVWVIGQ